MGKVIFLTIIIVELFIINSFTQKHSQVDFRRNVVLARLEHRRMMLCLCLGLSLWNFNSWPQVGGCYERIRKCHLAGGHTSQGMDFEVSKDFQVYSLFPACDLR